MRSSETGRPRREQPPRGAAAMRQPGRYLLVAGLAALGYLALLALGLFVGLHYFVAILLAQAVTIVSAFPLYRRFVFGAGAGLWSDFARFLVVWTGGAVSGIVVTPLLVELVNWHPLVAQIVAIGVVSIASFLAHRFFTFRTGRDHAGDSHGDHGAST